jgi:hypothetical protein
MLSITCPSFPTSSIKSSFPLLSSLTAASIQTGTEGFPSAYFRSNARNKPLNSNDSGIISVTYLIIIPRFPFYWGN